MSYLILAICLIAVLSLVTDFCTRLSRQRAVNLRLSRYLALPHSLRDE